MLIIVAFPDRQKQSQRVAHACLISHLVKLPRMSSTRPVNPNSLSIEGKNILRLAATYFDKLVDCISTFDITWTMAWWCWYYYARLLFCFGG